MELLKRSQSYFDRNAENSRTISCAKKLYIILLMTLIVSFLFASGGIFLLNSILSQKSLVPYIFNKTNQTKIAV